LGEILGRSPGCPQERVIRFPNKNFAEIFNEKRNPRLSGGFALRRAERRGGLRG